MATVWIKEIGRHTIGKEAGKTTRIKIGDHVRIGGNYYSRATNWTKTPKP